MTDPDGILVGTITLRSLIVARPDTPVRDFMRPDPISVALDLDAEQVGAAIARYNLLALPVVDADGRMQGIVTVDDALRARARRGVAQAPPGDLRAGRGAVATVTRRLALPRPIRRAQRSLRERLPNFRVHRTGLLAFLGVMGPGLIAGLAGNDAGGIATYSVLGAETGLSLLWIFPITTVLLVVVLEMAARMGAVSGQGLGDLIRDDFGIRWTLFAMVVLLIANGANIVAEFAGAAAALEIFGIPRYATVPIVAAGIWALVVFASYRVVERVFLSVAVVFGAYVVSAFVAGPDWGAGGAGAHHAIGLARRRTPCC